MSISSEILQLLNEFEYHDTLNPTIWANEVLKLEVKIALLKVESKFIEFIRLPNTVKIVHKVLTGSNASYGYGKHSDLDLHLIVDLPNNPELKTFLNTRKALWSLTHHPMIYQYPVECYIQSIGDEFIGSGIYDIETDEWIHHPDYVTNLQIDQYAVQIKAQGLMDQIDNIIKIGANETVVEDLKKKIREFRKSGLEQSGEYGIENLAFKELRDQGYLQKLADYEKELEDEELSLN